MLDNLSESTKAWLASMTMLDGANEFGDPSVLATWYDDSGFQWGIQCDGIEVDGDGNRLAGRTLSSGFDGLAHLVERELGTSDRLMSAVSAAAPDIQSPTDLRMLAGDLWDVSAKEWDQMVSPDYEVLVGYEDEPSVPTIAEDHQMWAEAVMFGDIEPKFENNDVAWGRVAVALRNEMFRVGGEEVSKSDAAKAYYEAFASVMSFDSNIDPDLAREAYKPYDMDCGYGTDNLERLLDLTDAVSDMHITEVYDRAFDGAFERFGHQPRLVGLNMVGQSFEARMDAMQQANEEKMYQLAMTLDMAELDEATAAEVEAMGGEKAVKAEIEELAAAVPDALRSMRNRAYIEQSAHIQFEAPKVGLVSTFAPELAQGNPDLMRDAAVHAVADKTIEKPIPFPERTVGAQKAPQAPVVRTMSAKGIAVAKAAAERAQRVAGDGDITES